MRPESFPTDDSLGRSAQPASAPLSAKEGAFGEENAPYEAVFGDVSKIIDAARESAVRSVNAAMPAAYWLIGRRIVEFEQSGEERAEYGAALIERLAEDLTGRFDRGFSRQNVQNMRLFYLSYPPDRIRQALSGKLALPPPGQIRQTPSGISEPTSTEMGFDDLLTAFPLPWSAYVRLLSVRNEHAREFYETEALRGGWSVRQLDRQIGSQFYERTTLSKNRSSMLTGGLREDPEDHVVPGEQIKDPFVLEFLDLKDEIFRVKFVHALDDGLHELACGGVVGVLGDGDDPDALSAEHGLEGDGVLALAGESGELPDENFPEGGVGLAALLDHLAELGPVGDVATLRLVDVLASDGVAVGPGVVPERPQLGGDGQVNILAVAGHPGVEGRRCERL